MYIFPFFFAYSKILRTFVSYIRIQSFINLLNFYQMQGTNPKVQNTYSFWKFIIFPLITFGIYPLVKFTSMSNDVARCDGKTNCPYWAMAIFLSGITLGIYPLIWWHNICVRIGNLNPSNGFSAGTFWGWCVLGALIIVGPLVFLWKLCNAMNSIAEQQEQAE